MATKKWVGGTAGSTTSPLNASNWSASGVPADGDSLIFPAGAAYNCDGNNFAADRQFVGFTVEDGCTISIGSAATPLHVDLLDGATHYAATLAGTGLSYLQIDNHAGIVITNAASNSPYGLNLTGVNDQAAEISVNCPSNARVSLGANAGEVLEVDTINVTGGVVGIGSGVVEYGGATAPDLNIGEGNLANVTNSAAIGALVKNGGTLTLLAGAITAYTGRGGTTWNKSTGTITTGNIEGAEVFDCSKDLRAKEITTINLGSPNAKFRDPGKCVTWTTFNVQNGADGPNLALGTDYTVTRG